MKSKIKYIAVVCGAGLGILCAAIFPKPKSETEELIRFAPENTTVMTEEGTAANPQSESESETEEETVAPITYTTMYTTVALNIRKWPEVCEESWIQILPVNTEVVVLDYAEGHMWEVILYEDIRAFAVSEYLSPTPVEIIAPETPESSFTYYGIWSGDYWHFTPEEVDAQWKGLKRSKPILPEGTTRAWQRYLYEKLTERGLGWFYKYAVAQAMQESGFNPLNQQGNDAQPDKGLFSFRIYYWNPAYGDIYDYHANINAYVDRISRYLTDQSEETIYMALSQHYNPTGQIHMNYVNYVLGRLNELWEVE